MPPNKRRKIESEGEASSLNNQRKSSTLDAPISPPIRKRCDETTPSSALKQEKRIKYVASPVSLIRVAPLSPSENIDTVGILDLLGDPLIKECWAFNFLFDVEWLLAQFDPDVRNQVRLNIVHGSWRKENENKIAIDAAAKAHENVRAITAYMPDPFGTHHTKMMILIRHDDAAQVVIFTANLIPRDWRMGQAVWCSPMLPRISTNELLGHKPVKTPPFGTGNRFGFDLRSYLDAYGSKLRELSNTLKLYDFSAVKACFIASTPSQQVLAQSDLDARTLWGWPALQESVKRIPVRSRPGAHIVTQVSSIATLGVTSTWLHGHLYRAMQGLPPRASGLPSEDSQHLDPKLSVVFPTADEIRRTIDGYACGGSIHYKLQSAAHEKQLRYLRPHLQHWAGDSERDAGTSVVREAGRKRTGPHIKTYVRFSHPDMTEIDWAMITSANLSKQAWGTEKNASGEVKISSFEVGVLFWPELWSEEGVQTRMMPTFKKNNPDTPLAPREGGDTANEIIVGWRMPYDLPLVPYAETEKPWCPAHKHLEPDWMGRTWSG